MSARTVLRAHVMALVLVALLFAGIPRAGAGRCAGADRARMVRLFEYLSFQMNEKLIACEFHTRDFLSKLRGSTLRLTPILSMGMIRLESRWTMRRLLIDEDFSTGKMADALQAHVDRAQLILAYTGGSLKVSPEQLKRIVDNTAGTLMVCQAMRQKSPKPCARLEDNLNECEFLAAKVVLLQGNCTNDAIRLLSETWHKKTDTVRRFCHAVMKQQPGMCDTISGVPKKAILFCRAFAGEGETACMNPFFSKAASRDCLLELRIQEVLAGKVPPSAIPNEFKKQELVWPALLAARGDISCDDLALEAYEKMVALLGLFGHTSE